MKNTKHRTKEVVEPQPIKELVDKFSEYMGADPITLSNEEREMLENIVENMLKNKEKI